MALILIRVHGASAMQPAGPCFSSSLRFAGLFFFRGLFDGYCVGKLEKMDCFMI